MVIVPPGTILIKKRVVTAERVGLFEPAIVPRGRREILVTQQQTHRLIFAGMFLQEKISAQMPKAVETQIQAGMPLQETLIWVAKGPGSFAPEQIHEGP
jgi:hypothetical protein